MPPSPSLTMSRIRHRWNTLCAVGFAALGAMASGAPIPHSLVQSMSSPATARQAGTQLGYAVALDGGFLAVGSPFDDLGGEDSGIVRIYQVSTGALLHVLQNPRLSKEARFGWSVAISGSRVVIGAPEEDTGANDTGIAYVYNLLSSTPTAPVTVLENPNPGINDNFGWSVAISGDRVAVGVPKGDSGVADAGCAYVYNLATGTPATPVAQLNNPDPTGQNFGYSVAASGLRVVIGSPQEVGSGDICQVHVYDFSLPAPETPIQSLADATPTTNEHFGWSVAIAGTTVAVSAPLEDTGADNAGTAYVYDLASGLPGVPVSTVHNPAPALNDSFGSSLAVSGNRLAVGSHLDDQGATESGRVHVFDLSSGTPTVPWVTVDNPGPQTNDLFGFSVALSGTRLATGAHGDNTGVSDAGSAYFFELSSGTPGVPVLSINTPSPSSEEEFGNSIGISGSIVVVGAYHDDKGANTNSGSTFLYDFLSSNPDVPILTLENPAPANNDYFGAAVAIAGNTVVVAAYQDDVGATNSGTVYVYNRASPTPTVPVLTIPNPSAQAQDQFGNAIALSGSMLVIGAAKNDVGSVVDAGSAYVYDLSSGTPAVPVAVLDNPAPATDDLFGISVAISGTKVAVGANGNDVNAANNAGSVYIYEIPSTSPVAILNNPSPTADDFFGQAVGISGSRIIVGSPFDNTGARDAGRAYAYNLASGTPTTPVLALNNPDPEPEDYFGFSVAISGTRLVIGALEVDSGALDAGAAFVYELESATSGEPADSLDHQYEQAGDLFGFAVAIDGTNIVVSAPLDDGNTFNRGSVHVFDPDPPLPQMQVEQPPGTGLIGGAASMQFGNAAVGVTGGSQTVVIRNVGTDSLTVTGIALVAGNTGDFAWAGVTLPATLLVDQTLSFQVSFTPAATGNRIATLRIASNAGNNNPFNITLTGHGLSVGDDTDGDGLNDVVELQLEALGFDWQVNDEELVAVLQSGANATGRYSGSQLQAMNPGTPLLPKNPATGNYKLTVAVKKSIDLMDFDPFPMSAPQTTINAQGGAVFQFSSPQPKAFFLLEPR